MHHYMCSSCVAHLHRQESASSCGGFRTSGGRGGTHQGTCRRRGCGGSSHPKQYNLANQLVKDRANVTYKDRIL